MPADGFATVAPVFAATPDETVFSRMYAQYNVKLPRNNKRFCGCGRMDIFRMSSITPLDSNSYRK